MGQPLEHGLRTCLLAVRVGERMGLPAEPLADSHCVSLLRFAGCSSHAHQDSLETGDEIAFRAGVAPILGGGTPEMMRFTITQLGRGSGALERARMVAGTLAAGSKGAREAVAATCEVARMVATRLGLGESVVHALDYT